MVWPPMAKAKRGINFVRISPLMPWRVYIVECKDGKLYTGITNNLTRRINEHNSGNGSRFTKYRFPVRLVFSRRVSGRPEALKREARIKRLTRRGKLELIIGKKERPIANNFFKKSYVKQAYKIDFICIYFFEGYNFIIGSE